METEGDELNNACSVKMRQVTSRVPPFVLPP